jgi:nicotinamidase-related amidase
VWNHATKRVSSILLPFLPAGGAGWCLKRYDIAYDALPLNEARFVAGVDGVLSARGITRLMISGIRSEQCCESTTRVASDLGYQVDYVTDATLTFVMKQPVSGRTYSLTEIREKTERVLAGRFATIVGDDKALVRMEG